MSRTVRCRPSGPRNQNSALSTHWATKPTSLPTINVVSLLMKMLDALLKTFIHSFSEESFNSKLYFANNNYFITFSLIF